MTKKLTGIVFLVIVLLLGIFLLQWYQIQPMEPEGFNTSTPIVDLSNNSFTKAFTDPSNNTVQHVVANMISPTSIPNSPSSTPGVTNTATPTPLVQVSGNDLDTIQSFLLARADFTNSLNDLIIFLSHKGNYNDLIQKLDNIKNEISNI